MADITIKLPDGLWNAIAATEDERIEFLRNSLALSCLQVKRWSKEDCARLLGISHKEFEKILIERGLNLDAPSLTHGHKPIDDMFFDALKVTPETKREVGRVLIGVLNRYFRAACEGSSSYDDIRRFRSRIHGHLHPFSPKVDYRSVVELREIAIEAAELLFSKKRDRDAIIWRELSEDLKFSPEYFMSAEEIAERDRATKKIGPEEVFNFIAGIESGTITIEPIVSAEDVWCGEVRYRASNGWELGLYIRAGKWRYICFIITEPTRRSSDTELFYDDFKAMMPDLLEYFPSDEVRWNIYRLPKLVTRTCSECGFYFTSNVGGSSVLCSDCSKAKLGEKK